MARYKLMADHLDGKGEFEIPCKRKSTKTDVEKWIQDNAKPHGIEWRTGFSVKFHNVNIVYTWRNIKNGEIVKYP